MALCYAFRRPVLFAFGASDASYPYAEAYLTIYLLGTPFTMLATGMNGFINAQGFPRVGMLTTVLGAVINLVLDPLFIFTSIWACAARPSPPSSARRCPRCGCCASSPGKRR